MHEAGGGGKGHVRGDGGHDDEVEVFRFDPGIFQGVAAGLDRQIAGRLIWAGNAALLDSSALDDPLVGGLDHALQVGIGQDLFRQVLAGSGDGDGAEKFGTHQRA